MRTLLAVTAIAGVLLLGSIPCYADSGSGVTIPTTIIVTGGGSGGGYSGGGGGYYTTPQPKQPSPYVPLTTNSPLPTPPTQPVYSDTTTPAYTPVTDLPPIEYSILPWYKRIMWPVVLPVIGGICLIGILVGLHIRQRKVKPIEPIDK